LPHAFRDVSARPGEAVVIDVSGPAGGLWTLTRDEKGWAIFAGEPQTAAVRASLRDNDAWKLLFNALTAEEASRGIVIDGRRELATPLLRARSVIV
jgi:hypothetical protein